MTRSGREDEAGLLALAVYALAAHGETPLTHPALAHAIRQALQSPAGSHMADAMHMPCPEPDASFAEAIGAFGDWLRLQRIMDGCGFSREQSSLTCEFRGCLCQPAVAALASPEGETVPPCLVVALLAALIGARGVEVRVQAFHRKGNTCSWTLTLEQDKPQVTARAAQ